VTRSVFDAFCQAALDLLKAERVRFLVIGGVAVSVVGEPRFTADLDVIAYIDTPKLQSLLRAAKRRGFKVDVDAELAAAAAGSSARISRKDFHLDIIVRSLFIEDLALAHGKNRRVFARTARFPRAEDLLVLKVVAGRPRDLADAEGIIRRHSGTLDRTYVEHVLVQVCELAEDHAIIERWHRLWNAAS